MNVPVTLADDVTVAYRRIQPYIRQTYLEHSPCYSELLGANVYLKCENLQLSGSFKLRGALNKYLSLSSEDRAHGVVAASTGNHGKAVAYAAKSTSGKVDIFVPGNADPTKQEAIRRLGATIHRVGADCIESESAAREFAEQQKSTYISPYNDPQVIAGQGTVGLEICEQIGQVDAVFASVGGGGLISGVASYIKSQFPNCQLIGCSPENSKVMFESWQAGKLLDLPSKDTLSDGTAGGVELDSITFDLCRDLIDEFVAVSESDIATHLVDFIQQHSMLIEGSAAVALASAAKLKTAFSGKNVVVILCGANISPRRLQDVFQEVGRND